MSPEPSCEHFHSLKFTNILFSVGFIEETTHRRKIPKIRSRSEIFFLSKIPIATCGSPRRNVSQNKCFSCQETVYPNKFVSQYFIPQRYHAKQFIPNPTHPVPTHIYFMTAP